MKKPKRIRSAATLGALIFAFAALASAQTNTGSTGSGVEEQPGKKAETSVLGTVTSARVYFIGLKDGAKVKSPFKVAFGVEGLKVAKAGAPVPGTGHHHLIVDGAFTPKGVVVGKDETHLHFGDGQTETVLTLPKGPHTLTLQFADGTHASYGEQLSQTINVTVR